MRIVLLSPHRDDACFSLGLSIVRWSGAGHRIRVVNCFSRSAYAPFSDADSVHANDRLSYVSALREKEDKLFFRRVPGADVIDLRLKDASLRLRCGEEELCNRPVDDADPAIPKIATALEKRVGADQVQIVLLPVGIGRHIDHSTVREAAFPFAKEMACGFYEDMPYAALTRDEAEMDELRAGIEAQCGWKLAPVICGAGEDAERNKRRMCEIYCSQVDGDAVRAMSEAAGRLGGERVWVNEMLAALIANGIAGWSAESGSGG